MTHYYDFLEMYTHNNPIIITKTPRTVVVFRASSAGAHFIPTVVVVSFNVQVGEIDNYYLTLIWKKGSCLIPKVLLKELVCIELYQCVSIVSRRIVVLCFYEHMERWNNRQTERKKDGQTKRWKDGKTERQKDRKKEKQKNKKTGINP